jgi:hypothetical protein
LSGLFGWLGARRIHPLTLCAAFWLVLAAPPSANACTSCPITFREFFQHNERIVLARYTGRSHGLFEYRVLDVLKGRSPATIRFKYDPADGLHSWIGSRWLFSTDVPPDGLIRANAAFRVAADGAVTPTETGAGRVEAPDTLAGWYAAIAALPDTATATSVDHAVTADPSREAPALFVVAAAVLGGLATLRRLASNDTVTASRRG